MCIVTCRVVSCRMCPSWNCPNPMLHDEEEICIYSQRGVSIRESGWEVESCSSETRDKSRSGGALTQRMATGQLGPLGVLPCQLVTDAIKQLDVALLRVLPERGHEGPRHGACGLGGDGRVGSMSCAVRVSIL